MWVTPPRKCATIIAPECFMIMKERQRSNCHKYIPLTIYHPHYNPSFTTHTTIPHLPPTLQSLIYHPHTTIPHLPPTLQSLIYHPHYNPSFSIYHPHFGIYHQHALIFLFLSSHTTKPYNMHHVCVRINNTITRHNAYFMKVPKRSTCRHVVLVVNAFTTHSQWRIEVLRLGPGGGGGALFRISYCPHPWEATIKIYTWIIFRISNCTPHEHFSWAPPSPPPTLPFFLKPL